MVTTAATGVVALDDEAARDPAQAGGKAAALAALVARGFPVPPGFVITTEACARILAGTGGDEAGGRLPSDVHDAVAAGLHALGDAPVAVRSSGTAEDLADASYAGQYETVLDVRGAEAVGLAVRRCLASATSERLVAYAGPRRAPMAVLVQRLVAADAAGVAFTANPVTGDAEILVSAVTGMGDRLVSGEATPDEWVVRGEDVTCARATEHALDAEAVREVAGLARRVQEAAGAPQDLEWAVRDGELYLLQARPITALPRPPRVDVPSEGFWKKDTTHYPTPLTPFGASFYLDAIDRAAPAMGVDFGFLFEGFEQRSLGGEVYVRFIPVGGRERRPPPPWALWIAARTVPALRRRARAAERAVGSRLWDRLVDRWETEWRDAFRDEAESLKRVPLDSLGDEELLCHLDRLKDFLDRGEVVHFRLSGAFVLPLYDLVTVCDELLGWDSVAALALVAGASESSSEPGRELIALAARFADDDGAVRALEEGGDEVLDRLQEVAPARADDFRSYLDRYGHRTAGYDPGDPTLFERPALFARLLRDRIADGERRGPDGVDIAEEALARARGALADRTEHDRTRFERAVESARRIYGNREENIFWADNQPCALLRYAAVEIGRRLAERGLLARATDAVFLEERELRSALVGDAAPDLRSLVARRRAERAWVAAHPGPVAYGNDPGAPPPMGPLPPALRLVNTAAFHWAQLLFESGEPAEGGEELRGVPGSPGRHTGPVRVVRDESEFAKLGPGDVLVCPITSPAWSVLFVQAGAVVTDGGGVLAHTAVIAREYGIPAVLATITATRRLHDGDVVTVDGTAGVVTINEGTTA